MRRSLSRPPSPVGRPWLNAAADRVYSGNGSIMGKRRPRCSPQSHCAHREAFEIGKRAVRKIGENEIFRRDDDPAYGGAGQVDRLLPASGSVRKLNKRALRSSDYPSPDDGLRNPLGTIQLANRRELADVGLARHTTLWIGRASSQMTCVGAQGKSKRSQTRSGEELKIGGCAVSLRYSLPVRR